MNRVTPYLFVAALAFAFAGGLQTAVDARKASERNARVKEINTNITKALDAFYTSDAKELNDLIDLAPSLRQKNWTDGGGSCVFATSMSLLRVPERPDLDAKALEIKRRYGGGESAGPHQRKMEGLGLKFVVTTDGDERLIDWAIATGRGCGIGYPSFHCVALIGKVEHNGQVCAKILDNNHTNRYDYPEWKGFVRKWKSLGGWAFAFVYPPPPPAPK